MQTTLAAKQLSVSIIKLSFIKTSRSRISYLSNYHLSKHQDHVSAIGLSTCITSNLGIRMQPYAHMFKAYSKQHASKVNNSTVQQPIMAPIIKYQLENSETCKVAIT
jgi:hypothetical protein